MLRTRTFRVAVAAVVVVLVGCTSSGSTGPTASPSTATPVTEPATMPLTTPATSVPATTVAPTTAAPTSPPTTISLPQQPAVWPAASVVLTTPEAAARGFVDQVFGTGPLIGPFVGDDQAGGEITVYASADGTRLTNPRSTLLLRRLAPSNGWFVLAAVSEFATITVPTSGSTVPNSALTVQGSATGFESTVNVRAFLAGHADREFDQKGVQAGNQGTMLPYSASLDLSTAAHGAVVVILVHASSPLENDPGQFSALPIVIA